MRAGGSAAPLLSIAALTLAPQVAAARAAKPATAETAPVSPEARQPGLPSADGSHPPRSQVVTRLLADVRAGKVRPSVPPCCIRCAERLSPLHVQWNEDAFLTPVLADDPLLFGLDVEDEDIVMGSIVEEEALPEGFGPLADSQAGGAGSLSSLRAENESLKLQARRAVSRWPRLHF